MKEIEQIKAKKDKEEVEELGRQQRVSLDGERNMKM